MGHMPPEPRIDLETPPQQQEAVVEFRPSPAPRRRWSAAGFGRSMAADRRLVPLAAVLGALAILVSLISEWQVTTLDGTLYGSSEAGTQMLPTDVLDLGGLGAAYLVGLFPLAAAVVLTMFGPPAGRRYLRLTGLSVCGTLLGLLIALTSSLGDESRIITRIYTIQLDDKQLTVGYGRGLWCAFAGVLLALAALYLADRHLPAPAEAPSEQAAGDAEAMAVWSWRRPAGADDERGPDEPLDLTVAPAKPFDATNRLPKAREGYPGEERNGPPVA